MVSLHHKIKYCMSFIPYSLPYAQSMVSNAMIALYFDWYVNVQIHTCILYTACTHADIQTNL